MILVHSSLWSTSSTITHLIVENIKDESVNKLNSVGGRGYQLS